MKTRGIAPVIIALAAAGILISAGACNSLQFQPPTGTQANPSGLPLSQCLPAGVKLSDQVGMKNTTGQNGLLVSSIPITLQEKLVELKAVCGNDRTLSNDAGKKIYLYSDTACWQGAAHSNYQELLAKQSSEVKTLEQQYIVIEIPCNGFVPIPP